ncbi:MAG: symmetrical bis(5'-nucleosyl)-tetraphosphatase [Buchnera aphidicola (Eriosoma harunire)]
MSTYFIGDVHGCYRQLQSLLKTVSFNDNKDIIYFTGDLIARGPASLDVMKLVYSLGDSAKMVLGNHELHFLLVYLGIIPYHVSDNFMDLLEYNEIDVFIGWLRKCPIMILDKEKKFLLVHAGIFPFWNLSTIITCANEVEQALLGKNYKSFLYDMYGNLPNVWSNNLTNNDRLRFIINVFTRMRYCLPNGELNFSCKSRPFQFKSNLIPWFLMDMKINKKYHIIFGHWSTLRGYSTPNNIIALDTGCCWGNELSMLRWEDKVYFSESFHS